MQPLSPCGIDHTSSTKLPATLFALATLARLPARGAVTVAAVVAVRVRDATVANDRIAVGAFKIAVVTCEPFARLADDSAVAA